MAAKWQMSPERRNKFMAAVNEVLSLPILPWLPSLPLSLVSSSSFSTELIAPNSPLAAPSLHFTSLHLEQERSHSHIRCRRFESVSGSSSNSKPRSNEDCVIFHGQRRLLREERIKSLRRRRRKSRKNPKGIVSLSEIRWQTFEERAIARLLPVMFRGLPSKRSSN
jgi:hypothetical protein